MAPDAEHHPESPRSGPAPASAPASRDGASGATPSAGPVDWQRLHLWQIQPVRDGILIASLIGLVYLGSILSVVTVPLLLALLLAYLFEPLVRWLTKRLGLGRPLLAATIIVLGAFTVFAPVTFGITIAGVQGVRVVQRLTSSVDLLQRSIRAPGDELLRLEVQGRGESWLKIRNYVVEQEEKLRIRAEAEAQRAAENAAVPSAPPTPTHAPPDESPSPNDPEGTEATAKEATPQPEGESPAISMFRDQDLPDAEDLYKGATWALSWARDNATGLVQRALSTGGGAAAAAAGIFAWTGKLVFTGFLTAFFFYFFCTGWGRVLKFWGGLIPDARKARVFDLVRQMDRVIAGFVRGRLTICFVLMVYFTLGYFIIGVPAWLVVGPLVGLLTLLPYAAGLGIFVSMLLLWLDPSSGIRGEWYWIIAAPLVVHGLQQLLDDYLLTPKIQGDATGMDTPSILFASVAGGVLGGFYGLLLAIPVAACVKILLKELVWPRFKAWARGDEQDPLPLQD
jgi:predicted PurR-regulated permease PerM